MNSKDSRKRIKMEGKKLSTNKHFQKQRSGSSSCGMTGFVVSLQHWDIGSNLAPEQWVKDPVLLQLGTPYALGWPKKKKKNQ